MEFRSQPLPPNQLAQADCLGLQIDFALPGQRIHFPAAGILVLALRDSVKLQCGDIPLEIPKGSVYFVPASQRTRAAVAQASSSNELATEQYLPPTLSAHSRGLMIVMRASHITWRALGKLMQKFSKHSVHPIPGLWPDARALCRAVLDLMHRYHAGQIRFLDVQDLFRLSHGFETALRSFEEQAQRCPGRGMPQKFHVLRRLMRVRQLMLLQCNQRFNVEQMAAHANYSRAHFLHIYRAVFAETPHAHLLEHRLRLAQHLLGDRGLSVNETTLAAGFEDRSSFSKLFHRRFGRTAVSMRQTPAA